MKNFKLHLALIAALLMNVQLFAQSPEEWKALRGDITFYMCNDNGRNGYYDQKPIAELMGVMGESVKPDFIVGAGDMHHFNGVQSVNDPLWTTNFETIYSHPELMCEWYPEFGNHEYRGNSQAVLDYARVSRRWVMPARYYTKTFEEDGVTLRIIWLDTPPLIEKYRKDVEKYPDASLQDKEAELRWLEATLKAAKEDWVVVVGHHPIYADSYKNITERTDMQQSVDKILRKYKVDVYACGHIHNFQHIRMKGSKIDYVVNGSCSLGREVNPIDGTVFCSPETGFSVFSVEKNRLRISMINKEGKVLHTVTRTK